jgi:hypothetical protein
VAGVLAFGALVALTVRYVVPWLRPFLVANARPLLGLAATVTVLLALNQVHRPWYVELERQGLADAPAAGLARAGMAAERSPDGRAHRRHPRRQDRQPGRRDPAS